MNNQRATGAVVALLGLLLTCCICPLVLDSLLTIVGGARSSLYLSLFSGSGNAALYVSSLQLICIALLAVIVLVVGIILVVRSGQRAASVTPLERY